MAKTRNSEKKTAQDDQAVDTAVMLMEPPAAEAEAIWIWELDE